MLEAKFGGDPLNKQQLKNENCPWNNSVGLKESKITALDVQSAF